MELGKPWHSQWGSGKDPEKVNDVSGFPQLGWTSKGGMDGRLVGKSTKVVSGTVSTMDHSEVDKDSLFSVSTGVVTQIS